MQVDFPFELKTNPFSTFWMNASNKFKAYAHLPNECSNRNKFSGYEHLSFADLNSIISGLVQKLDTKTQLRRWREALWLA